MKETSSHIPLSIRQWLDRQIVRELQVTASVKQSDRAAYSEEVVRERWLNASTAFTSTSQRH